MFGHQYSDTLQLQSPLDGSLAGVMLFLFGPGVYEYLFALNVPFDKFFFW